MRVFGFGFGFGHLGFGFWVFRMCVLERGWALVESAGSGRCAWNVMGCLILDLYGRGFGFGALRLCASSGHCVGFWNVNVLF